MASAVCRSCTFVHRCVSKPRRGGQLGGLARQSHWPSWQRRHTERIVWHGGRLCDRRRHRRRGRGHRTEGGWQRRGGRGHLCGPQPGQAWRRPRTDASTIWRSQSRWRTKQRIDRRRRCCNSRHRGSVERCRCVSRGRRGCHAPWSGNRGLLGWLLLERILLRGNEASDRASGRRCGRVREERRVNTAAAATAATAVAACLVLLLLLLLGCLLLLLLLVGLVTLGHRCASVGLARVRN